MLHLHSKKALNTFVQGFNVLSLYIPFIIQQRADAECLILTSGTRINKACSASVFFHPDYTVGFGVLFTQSPNLLHLLLQTARGLYRR